MSGREPEELTREQERRIDSLVRGLDPIEPSPQFEARFRARLARAEEAEATRGWRGGSLVGWIAGATAVGAVAILLSVGDPALPEDDWALVSDADAFELLVEEDLDLLASLDVIEAWDRAGTR